MDTKFIPFVSALLISFIFKLEATLNVKNYPRLVTLVWKYL